MNLVNTLASPIKPLIMKVDDVHANDKRGVAGEFILEAQGKIYPLRDQYLQ